MTKQILFSILFLFSLSFFAQNKEIDSLLTVLKTAKEDTNKVNLLNKLSEKAGWRIGKYEKAIEYADGAKDLAKKLNYKRGEANANHNSGNGYFFQGNYDEAMKNYQASVKLREEIGDERGVANSNNNIGGVYLVQGNYTAVIKYYSVALKIRKKIGDKSGEASSYIGIGSAYFKLGNYNDALKNYYASLKIMEEIGNKKGISDSYNNLANVYVMQDNYSEAKKSYLAAISVGEEIGDKVGLAASYDNIGILYKRQKKYPDAISSHLVSLKIAEEIGNKAIIANCYANIGSVYYSEDNFSTAFNFYKKAYDIRLEIRAKGELSNIMRSIYKISIRIDSLSYSMGYLDNLIALRKEDLRINYPSLAEQEKELYFATMHEDFNLQYDFALNYLDLKQQSIISYNNALLTKSLSLRSSTAMRNAILSSGDTLLINQYDEWGIIKRQISKNYETGKDVSELEAKANELERELVKKSTVFSDFDKAKNIDWKQVQASLKPKEAAIEFVHFKSEIDTLHPIKYAALIIKSESKYPEMISLCDEKDLEKILGAFQGNNLNYVNSIYGTKKDASLALYDKVWKPMEKSLQGITTVYYSPSGLLHKISFSALSNGKNTYLCDKYNLNRESSTGKVALPDNINYLPSDKIALIGGVKYNSDTTKKEMWTYLPGTLTEAEEINKLLKTKKHSVNYLASTNASETNFKKDIPQAEILHIATHGFFFPDPEKMREELKSIQTKEENLTFRGTTDYANWSFVNNKNPLMRSGIVLAGANDVWERDPMAEGEDGVLTAQEVSNMDMRKTKLVVLSACETGLGDIKGSEGVYGLQRAFKMAGVNYIVMSLWQVPDKETSEFMINFYKKLTIEKDIKKAFHATQKEMRKKYDPYYWAAFVLVE